jgi:hypothetical protein
MKEQECSICSDKIYPEPVSNWDEADEYYAEKENEMEQQIMKEKLVIPSMSKTYKDLKKGEENE